MCIYMYVFLSQRKVSTLLFFYMRNYHVRMGTGSWSFWVQNKKRCPKNRLPLPKNNNEKKPHTATLNATNINQSIHVYTHGTIKKKRAIVYYYVRIYTTANVSADTVEGDQQLFFL